MAIELAKHVDAQYLDSWGAGMFGMASADMAGLEIPVFATAADVRTVVIPLHLSNVLNYFQCGAMKALIFVLK